MLISWPLRAFIAPFVIFTIALGPAAGRAGDAAPVPRFDRSLML